MYAGVGNLGKASSAVRFGKKWEGVDFVPFDYPARSGDWRDRAGNAAVVCRDNGHAVELLESIQDKGGEGLIARKPGSEYKIGRSNDIIKVKIDARWEAA